MSRGKNGLKPALRSIAIMPLFAAGSAQAFPCSFATQCIESRACRASALEIDVDIPGKVIDTLDGLLTIVAVKETDDLTALFATGLGAEYLLSLTPDKARLTMHDNNGPITTTYLGQCEEAF